MQWIYVDAYISKVQNKLSMRVTMKCIMLEWCCRYSDFPLVQTTGSD